MAHELSCWTSYMDGFLSVWPENWFKFRPIFGKSGQNILNICVEDKSENPKHLHEITFEASKYLQQTVKNACLGENWLSKE